MTANDPAHTSAGDPPHAQDPATIRRMFEGIAPRYDLANHSLSMGMDFLWRRKVAARAVALAPSDILDVATGSGDLALALQRACQRARVVGADFCDPMLECARRKGLRETVLADALDLPFSDSSFDLVTVAFGLRNMVDREAAVRSMRRVLREGGRLCILDFSLPSRWPMRGLYRFYLHRILPVAAGILTGRGDAYRYLGASIEDFPSGEAMLGVLRRCGLDAATATPLTGGVVTLYEAARLRDA